MKKTENLKTTQKGDFAGHCPIFISIHDRTGISVETSHVKARKVAQQLTTKER